MSFSTNNFKIHYLDVKDADSILIQCFNGEQQYLILIDAGNLGDAPLIKRKLANLSPTNTIDLAICTHPDTDHFGGFFDLLNDKTITFKKFWLTDPAIYLNQSNCKQYQSVRKIFNHPNNSRINLIDLIISKDIDGYSAIDGLSDNEIPIKIIAPTADYYTEIAKKMVEEFGVKTYDECDTSRYDENALPAKCDVKSVIDLDDDPSPYNASSLVILFTPNIGTKFLFAGDANCASLMRMIELHREEVKNATILKVPHHGSKHNLTTEIIDSLSPTFSIISSKGSLKHPNSGIVYWLSQHGDVYSTHKSGDIHYPKSADETTAIPLRIKDGTKR
jgi:beta-lactamase superfamily II metal-dependent hydrolase